MLSELVSNSHAVLQNMAELDCCAGMYIVANLALIDQLYVLMIPLDADCTARHT